MIDVPGTLFNAIHQVKAIAIGISSKANPLVKIVTVFLFPSLNTYGTYVYVNYIKRGNSPILSFPLLIAISFHCIVAYGNNTNVNFQFKIDYDNGAVEHILGHLTAKHYIGIGTI